MEERISVKQWIENFNNGLYSEKDTMCAINAGWFDWFCSDSSLMNRTKKFGNIIKDITSKNILDNFYVQFKNCMSYNFYDTIYFNDLKGNYEKTFLVTVDEYKSHSNKNATELSNKYLVYLRAKGFDKPQFFCNTKKELLKIINNIGDNELK